MLKGLVSRLFRRTPDLIHVPEGQRLFRCFVHGENFPGEMLSLPYSIGFYTTRYIAATDAEAAELAVLARLREDPSLQLPLGLEKSKEARVYFERIEVVPNDTAPVPNAGFTFYQMGT
jgi:hypothetical protein